MRMISLAWLNNLEERFSYKEVQFKTFCLPVKSSCLSAKDNKTSVSQPGGLMVSVLDSGASGPGSSPGQRHCVSWTRHFTFTVRLCTQVYKWVLANLMLRGGGGVASHSGGSRNTPSHFMLQKLG